MITQEFEFHAPKTLAQVLKLLDDHGDRATILAGGMSLVPMMNLGLVHPTVIVSLNHLGGLDQVRDTTSALTIGATVRHCEIESHHAIRESFPLLSEAAALIGDVQVRHRGTIGGSLAHADPAADYLPVMVALDATFTLQHRRDGTRTVSATEFFVDIMDTKIKPSELLCEITIPKLGARTASAYVRLARIEGAYALASAAAVVDVPRRSVRVAIGGVCPRPVLIRLPLEGDGTISEAFLEQVGDVAHDLCAGAMEDLHGDAVYRRSLARTCARRAVGTAGTRICEGA